MRLACMYFAGALLQLSWKQLATAAKWMKVAANSAWGWLASLVIRWGSGPRQLSLLNIEFLLQRNIVSSDLSHVAT